MLRSPPSRRRGLKSYMIDYISYCESVASFAEAWIEILHKIRHKYRCWSPPSRRRGLKYSMLSTSSFVRQRRLLRGGVD